MFQTKARHNAQKMPSEVRGGILYLWQACNITGLLY